MENKARNKSLELKRYWNKRNLRFKDWYKLIQMYDELAQEGMESFVGNDPRAAYNLILGILTQNIPHRVPPELIPQQLTKDAAELSELYDIIWRDIYNRRRLQGRNWLRDLIGFILVTGWYSVFATMTTDGSRCVAEVWHPATVFPNWDDELVECAHIFTLDKLAAKRMIARNDWSCREPTSTATIYDYWMLDGNKVVNTISLNDTVVKPETYEPKFNRIPIFISPVGGLPDTGEMGTGRTEDWKGEIGQSFVATNENIYRYWSKWWTFAMQLLRDTAQPRTYEKSRSAAPIVKPEEWYKRGAHFKLGPEDTIGFIPPPPIPVEIRSSQLDMEAMMQRGGPPWTMYGDIKQQLTTYLMSHIAASTHQSLQPFHQGIIDVITDIDNFWLDMIRTNNYKPYGKSISGELPDSIELTASYEVRVPGELIQRATVARMLDPSFELSSSRIMAEVFPEIKNPSEELARIRASKAERHPVRALITLIESLKAEAADLQQAGDLTGANLYEKAANRAEAMLAVVEGEGETPKPPGARPEAVPPPARPPPETV